MKSFLMAGVLTVATVSFASAAKTYEITIAGPAKAGSVQLKPGQYRLKVDGSNATFTGEGVKNATTPVKVVTTDKKVETTIVNAQKEGDTEVIKDIELGGSKTKIEF